MRTLEYPLPELDCDDCAAELHKRLMNAPGVRNVTVDAQAKTVRVEVDDEAFAARTFQQRVAALLDGEMQAAAHHRRRAHGDEANGVARDAPDEAPEEGKTRELPTLPRLAIQSERRRAETGDHAGHDHPHDGHDHGDGSHARGVHGHAPVAKEGTVRVDLPVILPHASAERDQCVARLREQVLTQRGILEAHLDNAHDRPTLCLHYDAKLVTLDKVVRVVTRTGVAVTKRYAHETLWITGMDAADNAADVERVISRMAGVLAVSVNYAAERAHLEYDLQKTSRKAILAEIARMGYRVRQETDDHSGHGHQDHDDHGHDGHDHAGSGGHAHAHGSGGLAMPIASGILLAVGYLLQKLWLDWRLGESLAASADPHSLLVLVLYAGAYLAGGYDLARHGFKAAFRGSFDIEFLMVVAAIGAAILGEWPEGALLLFLFSLGHNLEHMAMGKARKAIRALGQLTPKTAHVVRDGKEQELPVAAIRRGDVVLVRPGERIPVDGKVLKGMTTVDQAPITGESVPVEKEPGSPVYAGTINGEALVEVETTRLASDTTIARVIKMVSEAQSQKGPTQMFTERFGRVFVPATLVAVILLWVVPPLLMAYAAEAPLLGRLALPWGKAFLLSMTILVAASPCALAISTPSAILSGIAQGARNGVLFKGGAHLESLGTVTAVAFDKTGTLTRGKPEVTDVVPHDGTSRLELLRVAASLERRSTHPLAKAVVDRAAAEGVQPAEVEGFTNAVGRGITATMAGEPVRIGSLRMFGDAAPPALVAQARGLESAGRTTMLVEKGGRHLGLLALADRPRPEARSVLERLKADGVPNLVMLTGDNARVASAIAADIGLTEVKADLMPEDKVSAIRELKARHGGVAMVGDGVNDAPAMANATLGVAMGAGGTDVALETADVALMADSLDKLPFAVGLSRKTRVIIRQNLVVSLGVIALLVPAALFGWASIGIAIIFHEGSTLVVVANALRLLRHGPGPPASGPSRERGLKATAASPAAVRT